ncbi:MAG: carboxylating nicotinate-nucleotide diphosphorylase [Dehalococcoidia bacterium]|nr:MAG: carboxylating nicotinate-nucleotide diphosphorylase [Dehalococcoidia bacterium]
MELSEAEVEEIVDRALAEDLGWGDVTTEALKLGDQRGTGSIVVKEKGVLAGINIAEKVFHRVDPESTVDVFLGDGSKVKPADVVAKVEGEIASVLKAERVALNFLQRLSGIASETNRYLEAVKGLPVRIMDTRKTTPGLRLLEKYAVRVGGGENHRMNLGDGMLIKDNHLAALRSRGLSIKEIVAKARENAPLSLRAAPPSSLRGAEAARRSRGRQRRSNVQARQTQIEIEVRSVQEAVAAAEAGADIIMLDNMSLEDMRKAVKAIQGRALIEASGGITLDKVQAVAETGVDFISVGALTHSARALDIRLELEIGDE